MAFPRTKKTKSTSAVKIKKAPTVYEIDGCRYKSKTFMDLHIELKDMISKKLVKSFVLPTIGDGQKVSKFGSLKAIIDDMTFDSVMEARFYPYLIRHQLSGEIKGFERQFTYLLQDSFKKDGKTVRPITYIADYVVEYPSGEKVVFDVKGQETPDFKLKRKMFDFRYRDLKLICVQYQAKTKEWIDLKDKIKEDNKIKKAKKAS